MNEYDNSLLYSCQGAEHLRKKINDLECVSEMVQTLDGIFSKGIWFMLVVY